MPAALWLGWHGNPSLYLAFTEVTDQRLRRDPRGAGPLQPAWCRMRPRCRTRLVAWPTAPGQCCGTALASLWDSPQTLQGQVRHPGRSVPADIAGRGGMHRGSRPHTSPQDLPPALRCPLLGATYPGLQEDEAWLRKEHLPAKRQEQQRHPLLRGPSRPPIWASHGRCSPGRSRAGPLRPRTRTRTRSLFPTASPIHASQPSGGGRRIRAAPCQIKGLRGKGSQPPGSDARRQDS